MHANLNKMQRVHILISLLKCLHDSNFLGFSRPKKKLKFQLALSSEFMVHKPDTFFQVIHEKKKNRKVSSHEILKTSLMLLEWGLACWASDQRK